MDNMTLEQAIELVKSERGVSFHCEECKEIYDEYLSLVLSAAESYLASQQASKQMGVVEYEEYLRNRAAQEGKE